MALAPIALGREVIEPLGVHTSPDLIIFEPDGVTQRTLRLDSFVEYRICRSIAADRTQNVFRRLSAWGPEFVVVAKAMNEGAIASDLVLSPPIALSDLRSR